MNKFKAGDRVVVIVDNYEYATKGETGTVLEDSCGPWVHFDKPHPMRDAIRSYFPNVPKGHLGCIGETSLVLIQPASRTRAELDAEIARLQKERDALPREPRVVWITQYNNGVIGIVLCEFESDAARGGTAVEFREVVK